jgi:hypothetical protein
VYLWLAATAACLLMVAPAGRRAWAWWALPAIQPLLVGVMGMGTLAFLAALVLLLTAGAGACVLLMRKRCWDTLAGWWRQWDERQARSGMPPAWASRSLPAGLALSAAAAFLVEGGPWWRPGWLRSNLTSLDWTSVWWRAWWQHESPWMTLPLMIPALQLIVLSLALRLSPAAFRDLARRSLPVSVSASVWLGLLWAPVFGMAGFVVIPAMQLMALPVAAGIWTARSQRWLWLLLPGSVPVRLTRLAVLIAGQERQARDHGGELLGLDREWRSLLHGATSKEQRLRLAVGFVWAGLTYRWHDAVGPSMDFTGKLIDRLLASRLWSAAAVIFPSAALAALLLWHKHGHLHGVKSVIETLAIPGPLAALLLFLTIRLGKRN